VSVPSRRRKEAWDHSGLVALPLEIGVRRIKRPARERTHASWHPNLAFAARFTAGPKRDLLVKINQFVLDNRSKPMVAEPYRIRSLQIAGDEKAFDDSRVIIGDTLCGQVSLSVLWAYNPAIPLPREDTGGEVPAILVVENLHTYDAIAVANKELNVYRSVAWGGGNRIAKRVLTSEAVRTAMERSGTVEVEYFGDIDAQGIDIAYRASQELVTHLGLTLRPAIEFYEILAEKDFTETKSAQNMTHALSWMPEHFRARFEKVLREGRKIPQERLSVADIREALQRRRTRWNCQASRGANPNR
jgi:hypothetical protein